MEFALEFGNFFQIISLFLKQIPSPCSIGCMKYKYLPWFLAAIMGAFTLPVSCVENPVRSSYRLLLPDLPDHWLEILGEAQWRLEWVNENGAWQEWEGRDLPDIRITPEWTIPVLAWPFWPERGLLPGMMRPSGALFPWDACGDTLALSWRSGVEAVFWKEMSLAERPDEKSGERLPWYFDWPRFRELMESADIPGNVRQNPWLPDWESIAQKTILSGFDRRRIVSRTFSELTIPGMGGRWIGCSPFEPPLEAAGDYSLTLNVTDAPEAWVSDRAFLKCSGSGWVYRER